MYFTTAGPPKLYLPRNRIMEVKVNEEVILNCTASASPGPVYSWSFPDSCSSCPNTNNDSVFIFTAEDIKDSGEYTCIAENQYGTDTKQITIRVLCKFKRMILKVGGGDR